MKIQAFFTALLLLAVVILAVYLYTDKKLIYNDISENKGVYPFL